LQTRQPKTTELNHDQSIGSKSKWQAAKSITELRIAATKSIEQCNYRRSGKVMVDWGK